MYFQSLHRKSRKAKRDEHCDFWLTHSSAFFPPVCMYTMSRRWKNVLPRDKKVVLVILTITTRLMPQLQVSLCKCSLLVGFCHLAHFLLKAFPKRNNDKFTCTYVEKCPFILGFISCCCVILLSTYPQFPSYHVHFLNFHWFIFWTFSTRAFQTENIKPIHIMYVHNKMF